MWCRIIARSRHKSTLADQIHARTRAAGSMDAAYTDKRKLRTIHKCIRVSVILQKFRRATCRELKVVKFLEDCRSFLGFETKQGGQDCSKEVLEAFVVRRCGPDVVVKNALIELYNEIFVQSLSPPSKEIALG